MNPKIYAEAAERVPEHAAWYAKIATDRGLTVAITSFAPIPSGLSLLITGDLEGRRLEILVLPWGGKWSNVVTYHAASDEDEYNQINDNTHSGAVRAIRRLRTKGN